MDERVKRALAQWPNVPDAYGWLALGRNGQWRLRGESVTHGGLNDFINRNYVRHERGGYAFQNGPQCVHVALDYLPFVWTFDEGRLIAHTEQLVARLDGAFVDGDGTLILVTELGPGEVRGQDLAQFVSQLRGPAGAAIADDALAASLENLMSGQQAALEVSYQGYAVPLEPVEASAIEQRLGFVRDPQPAGA